MYHVIELPYISLTAFFTFRQVHNNTTVQKLSQDCLKKLILVFSKDVLIVQKWQQRHI